MVVGTLQVHLYLPAPQSLKEKRVVLRSLVQRIKNHFNVAVSEVDEGDLWQRTTLGIAAVGNDRQQLNRVLDNVLDFMESVRSVQVVDFELSLI